MSDTSATIIAASLNSDDLEKSINKLVATVATKTKEMADNFTSEIARMEQAVRNLGKVKVNSSSSADGGSSRRTSTLKREEEQAKNVVAGYDAIAAANNRAAQSASTFIQNEREQLRMRQHEIEARLKEIQSKYGSVEVRAIVRDDGTFGRAIDNIKQKIQEARQKLQEVPPTSALGRQFSQELQTARVEYSELLKSRKAFESQSQVASLTAEYQQNNQKIKELASAYAHATTEQKQLESSVNSGAAAIEKYGNSADKAYQKMMKLSFDRAINIPTKDTDLAAAKLERLQAILADHRFLGALSPSQIARARKEVDNLEQALNTVTTKQEHTTQSAHQYTEEIRRQAQAIRESVQWQEKGYAIVNGVNVYNLEKDTTPLKSRISLEEQLLQLHKSEEASMMQQAADEEKVAQATRLTGEELKKIYQDQKKVNEEINKRAGGIRSGGTTPFQSYDSLRQSIAAVLGIQEQQVKMADAEKDSYNKLASTLKQLKQAYDTLGKSDRNSDQGKTLVASMHEVERAMQKIRSQAARPVSLESVIGINGKGGLSEKTLDDIAYKMQRLSSLRSGLNVETQKKEISTVNAEYDRLKKKMDDVMQKNQQMIGSNNALGRSWNYMKNRLAFYFTVGASTAFIKNLIEVRSQYEMNERALGILINSAERGTQIFNELSQMALVSPYTLIELSAAAKQLTAYDIAARDVVDTTRRLADMASAVGVPIERLTYALGQIKAYGYLNSRDARMFANAGIPLVKQLSDYYTELEGKMVSTADVYDRMKKKAIDYNSVMSVITKMTDEGGKFFDFQAKMADTLKVRLANLTLAWNNMLNDMGKETQGVLTWSIGALRSLFLQWKNLYGALNEVALVFGVAKALQFLGVCAHAAGIGFGSLNKYMKLNSLLGTRLAATVRTLGSAFMSLVRSPLAWFTMAALLVTEIGDAFINADRATKEFNKSLRDGAKTTYEDLKKFAEQYKNVRDSLYTTQKTAIGNIYDPSTGKAAATAYANQTVGQDISASEAKKVWEAMREQIELSSHASDEYISKLLSIENVSERLRQGFQILDDIQTVSAALKEIGEDGIKVTQSWAAWWNAWQGADGLIGNVKDLQKEIQRLQDAGQDPNDKFTKVIDKDYATALERFRKDLKVTTDSVINFINLNGWSGDTGKIDEVFKQVTDKLATQGNLDPQTAFTLQKDVEIARAKAAKEALEIRISDEKNALAAASDEISKQQIQKNLETLEQQKRDFDKFNGENRAYWNDFTKYIKERHISELTAAYNSMTDHGKKAMDFQSEEWQKRVHDWANRYEKSHNLATDSVFNRLKNWINDANTWSVFIKMTISTEDGKSVYKQLEEYDKAADDAWKTMQRLDKRISQLRKKGAKEVEGAETGAIDLSRVSADDKELTEALKERTQAQEDYNNAVEKGGESKKENAAASKAQKAAESELQKALKDELQLIDRVRSQYKKLVDAGANSGEALAYVTNQFGNSLARINSILGKNGIPLFDISKFAGTDNPQALLDMLKLQLDSAKVAKNIKPEEIKELEVKYSEIVVDAKAYNLSKITKGLNNELDKLKEEYELAVALDADPELGNIFAEMFDINVDELPHSINEYAERVTNELNDAIKKRKDKIQLPTITGLTKDDIKAFREMSESGGLNVKSFEEIEKAFTQFRELRQKAASDVAKIANDYIREYGDISAQIELIEKEKNNNLTKLNDVYNTEALRKTKDYTDAKAAIIEGAARKEAKATFEFLKKSTDYERFFTAIDTLTKKDALKIKNKIKSGIIDAFKNGGLTVSQFRKEIKNLEEQFDKLIEPTQGWVSYLNGGFDALIQKAKNTGQEIESIGEQISITGNVDEKDKNFLQSFGKIFSGGGENGLDFTSLLEKFGGNIEGLGNAVSQAGQGMQGAAGSFASAISIVDMIIKGVHQTVQAIASVIDELNSVRSEDNKIGNAYWEGFKKFDNYAFSGWENLKSGNVAGAMGDTANSIISIFNAFSNAKNEKINKQLKESARTVKDLENAYKDLEVAVNKSLGDAETGARRVAIENKKLQLAELERQLQLEESRSSKRRDDDRIKELQGAIIDARNEIQNMTEDVVNSLTGEDVKNAAEEFVDAWVEAWKAGETTLDSIQEKMDDIIENIIKKAVASKIVGNLLKPFYDAVDSMTSETSEGGVSLTTNELRQLAQQAGVKVEEINTALGELYGELANIGIISPTEKSKELSALQQGLQSMSESTANALEAYANSISQQVYLHSELLTQIRDVLVGGDSDIQLGVQGQMLLQLQNNYIIMQSIQSMMEGWTTPSGQGIRVELLS